MTLRQEAYKLIDTMTDDNIRILIQLMYRLEPKTDSEPLNFSKSVTSSGREQSTDEYVKDLKADDRMEALRWMQKKHEEMSDNIYADLDFEKEREEALTEKYGDFA